MAAGDETRGKPSTHDEGSAAGDDALALTMRDLARALEQEDDPADVLEQVVVAAIELIPGVDEGSISVVLGRQRVESRAPSSHLPRLVDAAQEETGEGPCLDAVYTQRTVRVPDMRSEQRWPQFSRRAFELGAASMLSFQLYVEGDNLGALNLYAREANAFTDESEHVGLLFAAHAAIAYVGARKEGEFNEALSTRGMIGQAMGILMERYKIDADRAFMVLVRASQAENRKLRHIAEELVTRRALPGMEG